MVVGKQASRHAGKRWCEIIDHLVSIHPSIHPFQDGNNTLFITHASRSDIVTGYLVYAASYEKITGKKLKGGILLAGQAEKPYGGWPDQGLRQIIKVRRSVGDVMCCDRKE